MKLPNKWSDITVKSYLQFLNTNDILEQVAFLCGLDIHNDEIMSLSFKEVMTIKKSLEWIKTPPTENTPPTIQLNGLTFIKQPINSISVFEWRTYDYYTRQTDENLIAHFIATMYKTHIDEWDYDLNKRAILFEDLTMDYWGVNEWVKFKKLCFEKYPLASDTVETTENTEENYLQRSHRIEAERKQKIANALNWEKIMLAISNDSALEAYKAMRLPVLYVFRVLTLRKEQ